MGEDVTRVAALFVARGGVYFGREDVDPWDEARDARLYAGPWPVVCHSPCTTWSQLTYIWQVKRGTPVGEDGHCFAHALACVRAFGGVLEHPARSAAWRRFGLIEPPSSGGWVSAGDFLGWTCHVEQGHYGHVAPKATWLYAAHVQLPSLRWGPSGATGRIESLWSKDPRRSATPPEFAELLLSIARSARVTPSR